MTPPADKSPATKRIAELVASGDRRRQDHGMGVYLVCDTPTCKDPAIVDAVALGWIPAIEGRARSRLVIDCAECQAELVTRIVGDGVIARGGDGR